MGTQAVAYIAVKVHKQILYAVKKMLKTVWSLIIQI